VTDHEKRQKAARLDIDDSTGSKEGDSDKDYENQKQSATASPTLKTNKQQNIVGNGTQEHWKASYAHIVRDRLNQKQNVCFQDLHTKIRSKCPGIGS
jgi:TolA-binding protein